MGLFTSNRERHLWLWTVAVVVAIWSSLGLAGTLVEILRDRRLLDGAFFLGFLLTLGIISTSCLERFTRREFWALLGIATAYGMIVVRMGIPPVERTHLFEYGIVAVLIHKALKERRKAGRRVPMLALTAIVLTALLGWIDEAVQGLLPNRVYDLRDVMFNTLAAVMSIVAVSLLEVVQRSPARRPDP